VESFATRTIKIHRSVNDLGLLRLILKSHCKLSVPMENLQSNLTFYSRSIIS